VGGGNYSIYDLIHGVVYVAVGIAAGGSVWRSGEFGSKAGLAVDGRADGAGALLAERLAAVLAKGNSFTIGMVGAVHTSLPSCTRRVVQGLTLGKSIARGCGRYGAGEKTGLGVPEWATT
jgi:hypothetical protein